MRVFSLLSVLIVPICAFMGYLWFDYSMANRVGPDGGGLEGGASGGQGEPVTFGAYVSSWIGLAGAAADAGGGVTELADMLPPGPEGWKRRALTEGDRAALDLRGLNARQTALVLDAYLEDQGRALTEARAAWETPQGLVVAELVRYPDVIFTSFAATQVRMELEMAGMDTDGSELIVARGMPVSEVGLPPHAPRVLRANLGAQIWFRATAPAKMSDADLLAFLGRLNVPAMNASLARPIKGMGEVPIMVLVSEVAEETLAAREAERAANQAEREAEQALRQKEWEMKAEEERALEAEEAEAWAKGEQIEEEKGVTVRRGVKKNDPGGSTFRTSGKEGELGGACRQVGGRKICDTAPPEAEAEAADEAE